MAFLDLNADIKPWLGIDVSNTTHDSVLNIINASVEQAVLNFTEAQFVLTPVIEILDASKSDQIVTREFPIDSVTAVFFDVQPDGTDGNLIAADEYQVLPEAIILAFGRHTPFGRSRVRVDYTHGFDGLPDDVFEAMLLAVEAKFRRKGRKSLGIGSRSKKDESERFTDSITAWDKKTGLPVEVVYMLQPYKRYEFPTQPIAQRNV